MEIPESMAMMPRRERITPESRQNCRESRSALRMAARLVFIASALAVTWGLSMPARANVYWTNGSTYTVGIAQLNGTGADQSYISGAKLPYGVAVDSAHIYWANSNTGTIGRANLDGTGVNQSFITANSPAGVAVDGAHIYWTNFNAAPTGSIGRANSDGTNVIQNFITTVRNPVGVAVDSAHIYWANTSSTKGGGIGRANLDGSGVNQFFISVNPDISNVVGVAAPPSSWAIPTVRPSNTFGVAVDSFYIYWTQVTNKGVATIGRANLDGSGVNPSFIAVTGTYPIGVALDQSSVDLFGFSGTHQSRDFQRLQLQVFFGHRRLVGRSGQYSDGKFDRTGH